MTKVLRMRDLYDQVFDTFQFDGVWAKVFGEPTRGGIWLIYGAEKNGKTTFALQLADYLSRSGLSQDKVLYVSAEEGKDKAFVDACERNGIDYNKKGLLVTEYVEFDEIKAKLKKRRPPRIVFIDNMTIYADEVTKKDITNLKNEFPNTLFIILAHEERREPSPAIAKHCRKLAKIILHVQGLACFVSGRCPGGKLIIDEQKAAICHGQD